MLYPKKNLVPTTEGMLSTTQSYVAAPERVMFPIGWNFSSTEYVTIKGPYEFELTAVQNNRDIRVILPVKPLTVYKPSCETNGDVHVFYLDKTKTVPLGQAYNTISAPYTISTPANCEYVAFALTNRGLGAGKFNFKNWQLEEVAKAGDPATAFEPFQLTNKRAAVRKDVIAPDIQGTSHNFVSGNLYKVKQDVRLTKAKFESLTAGTFNVAIYEWVEGTGKVGQPLFMRDAEYGIGVYSYDFGGITLKAGKTYFIGRYDQTNAAAIKRITGGTINVGNYVEWVGGTTLSQTTTIYPTSYYSFFAIEFELVNSAKLISDGALNVPLTSDLWVLRSGTTYKRFEGNRVYWNSNADYAGIQLILANMGYKDSDFQGKDIVFGGDVHPLATVMFYYKRADGTPTYIGVSKVTDNGARAMTIPYGTTEHRIYVQSDAGGRGELWCENVYVKFGTEKGIKPYNPTNKKAAMYPKKNLIKGFSSYIPNGVFIQQMYEEYRVQAKSTNPTTSNGYWLVDVKPFTDYTFSLDRPSNMDIGVFNADATKTIVNYKLGGDVQFNSGANSQVRCYVRGSVPNDVYELGKPMLKEGGSDIFEPYQLTSKRAVLYPQKNLFPTDSSYWESGSIASGGQLTTLNNIRLKDFVPVEPNTQYIQSSNDASKTIVYFYDASKSFINTPNVFNRDGAKFTTPSNCVYLKVVLRDTDDAVTASPDGVGKKYIVQIEKGSTQTPYEPYRLGNKRA
ncbi:tail protein [Bacillus phage Palmer]|uniref:Tail protein n=1 Tax=Bacillus phage Palmer TaxID=1597966 RepID=A0A0C5AFF3_9CAUD|nr:tail protein [Bacillus phage Palmer]AJK28077.1 tail protein [Bacillus phage Palmer]